MNWNNFIEQALAEDVREGDHTSLSCISNDANGSARLLIKDTGILAGVELAEKIFFHLSPQIQFTKILNDGTEMQSGQIAFELAGNARAILTGERLALNCMQRMSGIATLTNQFVKMVEGTQAKILDTRKTTPLFRAAEKWAVKIGGGENHRFGLFDMILIKDNHIDYAGGIVNAIEAVKRYLLEKNLQLKVEIEARTLIDVALIMTTGGVDRIMLDNFSLSNLQQAVNLINRKFETEASGGVTLETVRAIAETGVDYISVGALTHSYQSCDMSLKANIN
ncbi:MAG: carboxylating nicotinate-nucleotide diphosphorylase [Chitinophagales bacterium]|nr:carboxylating nicotinate-nucleotide diphosphorylase [Chitinophagales bacterium]